MKPRSGFVVALCALPLVVLAIDGVFGLIAKAQTPPPPCHSGHHEVMYIPSYWSTMTIGQGLQKINVPIMHPAWCRKIWVCDNTCPNVDVGLPEASHTYDHPVYETTPVLDYRCKEETGGEWRAKREYEN